MADALRERVASGAYASESDVVRDGLRALFVQEKAVESWLRTEVADAYDELRADPSRAISSVVATSTRSLQPTTDKSRQLLSAADGRRRDRANAVE